MGIHEEVSEIVASHWPDDLPEGELEVMEPDDSLWSSLAFWCLIIAIAAVFGGLCALIVRIVL